MAPDLIPNQRDPQLCSYCESGLSPKFPPFRSRVSSPSDAHDWA